MKQYALLTSSGADRVGIADAISTVIFEHGCNIEESKMAVLGGEFAMIILVSGQQSEVKQLLVDLPGFAREAELELSVKETAEPRPNKEGRAYRIDTTSLDTPGIVHAVTDLLKTFGVSVDELETESTGAPFTGAPMFHMTIRAIVPTGVGIRDLRDALDAVARERDLDVNISPILPAPS